MMGSNPFGIPGSFESLDSSAFSNCPLADESKAFSPEKIDKDALDKPLAKDPDATKNFSETSETTRELTEEEKQALKDGLEWPDFQIAKCTIKEDGTIVYRTDLCNLEGQTGAQGIEYDRKTVDINGYKVEGVFPKFPTDFEYHLPEDKLKSSNSVQFRLCNQALKEAVDADPELRSKFTKGQLEDIAAGDTPEGYTWHHNEEGGKMQLVRVCYHDKTQGGAAHTGGKSLWGGGYIP